MAQGWWDRFLRFVGFGPDDDGEDVEVAATAEEREEERRPVRTRPAAQGPNVVNLASRHGQGPGAAQPFKVLVVEPRQFEDVQGIVDQLRGRRPVILNLEQVDKETAQRILNFLNGAIYALGGDTQKVSSGIFFFAPQGVDVANLGRGLSGAAIGGASYDPADLADALSRTTLADGRGGLYLPKHPDAAKDPTLPDWRR